MKEMRYKFTVTVEVRTEKGRRFSSFGSISINKDNLKIDSAFTTFTILRSDIFELRYNRKLFPIFTIIGNSNHGITHVHISMCRKKKFDEISKMLDYFGYKFTEDLLGIGWLKSIKRHNQDMKKYNLYNED